MSVRCTKNRMQNIHHPSLKGSCPRFNVSRPLGYKIESSISGEIGENPCRIGVQRQDVRSDQIVVKFLYHSIKGLRFSQFLYRCEKHYFKTGSKHLNSRKQKQFKFNDKKRHLRNVCTLMALLIAKPNPSVLLEPEVCTLLRLSIITFLVVKFSAMGVCRWAMVLENVSMETIDPSGRNQIKWEMAIIALSNSVI